MKREWEKQIQVCKFRLAQDQRIEKQKTALIRRKNLKRTGFPHHSRRQKSSRRCHTECVHALSDVEGEAPPLAAAAVAERRRSDLRICAVG